MIYAESTNGHTAGPNTSLHMIGLYDLEGQRPRRLEVQEEIEHLYDNPVYEGRSLTSHDPL
jgi:hypothetical protein